MSGRDKVKKIPVSVIIVTKNEARRIETCLRALSSFDEVIVVDSCSDDDTAEKAGKSGVKVVDFQWNGAYPKKRQYCLETLSTKHDFIFFLDADELVTPALAREIAAAFERKKTCAGYFVSGQYRFENRLLRFGLRNKKLCLFDKRKFYFPVIDDLEIAEGMGEIEGHYQPLLKPEYAHEKIGVFKSPLIHDAYDDAARWEERHERYARWEAAMNARGLWPQETNRARALMKALFRMLPCRGVAAFLHCYVLKLGFLDGGAGLRFALSRRRYYRKISAFS